MTHHKEESLTVQRQAVPNDSEQLTIAVRRIAAAITEAECGMQDRSSGDPEASGRALVEIRRILKGERDE